MPRFQDSLTGLTVSQQWSSAKKEELQDLRNRSIARAMQQYEAGRKVPR
jgi:hypothetical protein